MGKSKKSLHLSLYKTLFLDGLFDRATRPIFIYITVMVAIGAVLFNWLEVGAG